MHEQPAMNVPSLRNMGSISLVAILFSSLLIIISSSASAEEPAAINSGSESLDTGQVYAASGSNRFVVWTDSFSGNTEIFFRRSTDNGATWKSTLNLSNNPGPSEFPKITVSGSNVYVAWFQENAKGELPNVFFRGSTDNGATWGARINISTSGTVLSFPNSPDVFQLAASSGNVYIIWQQNGDEVSFRRSTDNGATWKSIINLTTHGDSIAEPQIAVSGSNVYAAWTSSGRDTIFRRSSDSGATWKPIFHISDNPGFALNEEIAVSGSNVYVVWLQNDDFMRDMFFRRSADNGATWHSVKKLSDDAESPDMDASGSSVYVVWGEGVSEGDDIFFRRSADNGATWKSEKNLSNDAGISINPRIAV